MKHVALHNSYGWMNRYWSEGDISPDTTEQPPVDSKILGPLFRPLVPEDLTEMPQRIAERPGAADVVPGNFTPANYPGSRANDPAPGAGKKGIGKRK